MPQIKAIVFDLDGVLFEARDLHKDALNQALIQCGLPAIPETDHLATYNGLPTKTKLKMLGVTDPVLTQKICDAKQLATHELLAKHCKVDVRLLTVLQQLRDRKYPLAVASNSIRASVQLMIKNLGAMAFFEFMLSNEDVSSPKPHPEIYLLAAQKFNLQPWEILVVEDSPHGQRACLEAGCRLCVVHSPEDVTLSRLLESISEHETLGYLMPSPKPRNRPLDVREAGSSG
jgi:HAD superfamily hydrolase (TIGR01509 family)